MKAKRFLALLLCCIILLPLLKISANADIPEGDYVYKTQITSIYDGTYKTLRYETEAFCTGSTETKPHDYTYQWERVKIEDTEKLINDNGIQRKSTEAEWPWSIMAGETGKTLKLDLSKETNNVAEYYYRCIVGDVEGCAQLVSNRLDPAKAIKEYVPTPAAPEEAGEENKTEAENIDQDADPFEYVAVWHCTNPDRNNGRIVVHSSWGFRYEYRPCDALGNSNAEWKSIPGGDISGLSCPKGENASQWYVIRGTLGPVQKTKAVQVGYDPNSEAAGKPLLTEQTLRNGNVTVSGLMPEGSRLKVTAIPLSRIEGYVGEDEEFVAAYDISIFFIRNGVEKEFEPEEGNMISVRIATDVEKEDNVTVTHLEDAGTVEEINPTVNNDGSLAFQSDSFSIYIVTVSAGTPVSPEVTVSFGSWKDSYYCKATEDSKAVTVRNTGNVDLYEVKIVSSDSNFEIIDVPESILDTDNKSEFSCKLKSKADLTEGSYKANVKVTAKYMDGAEEKTYTLEIKDNNELKVIHNYHGGWCLGCDAYDSTYSAKITAGAGGRTYFRNNSPVFYTDLLYRGGGDGHWFRIEIDPASERTKKVIDNPPVAVHGDQYAAVTLDNSILISLRTGRHSIYIYEFDGKGNYHVTKLDSFRVSSAVDTGDTFDSTQMVGLIVLGLTGAAFSIIMLKNKRFAYRTREKNGL